MKTVSGVGLSAVCVDFQLPGLQRYVVQVRPVQVPLAHRAVVVGSEPKVYTPFAKLVTAYRQHPDREFGLADYAEPLFLFSTLGLFKVDNYSSKLISYDSL